jgi:protein-L-isoaspartate(D-aspartate) O-methyltransferase
MDIEKARFNMIEQQIRPWDVLDPEILEILALVRREEFVPPAYQDLAFADVEIPLVIDGKRTGQSMFTPKVEARLLQSLGVRRHESALEIGTGSGYGTALLAQRTRKIQSWEIDPVIQAFAAENLRRAGIVDVRLNAGDGSRLAGEERFDVIILSGSVAEVPESLLARLNEGGRLFAVVGEAPTMHGRLYTRIGKGCTSVDLFETVAARLQGFPAGKRFKF